MKLNFLISILALSITFGIGQGFYYGDEDDDSSSGINETFAGSYLIVAPKNIRPGLPYAISVNILKSDGEKPVSIHLIIMDENNKTIVQKEEDVNPGKPVTVKIDKVPNKFTDGIQYKVKIVGKDHNKKQLFDSNRRINFNQKGLSVFIQSDKKIYKPGSTVHFRVVAVYPDLKPYKGVANIKVVDPNQNVLQIFNNVSFEHGVIGKEDKMKIQLTEEPPLGEWVINVKVDSQEIPYQFTVDKYVLPKFDVTVKPPPYMLLTDDLAVTVSSKYTYGKGVAGTATLLIEYPYYWYRDGTDNKPKPISKTIDLDKNGEAVIRVPNGALYENKLLSKDGYGSNYLSMTATVTETLTGIQRNGTGTVTAYPQPYQVAITKQGESFQPGLDYTYTVAVTTKDDKPLPESADHKIEMTINFQFPYETDENGTLRHEPIEVKNVYTLEKDGTKTVTFKTLDNATSLSINANYGNTNETTRSWELRPSQYVDASKSPTKSYLQITSESDSVHAGSDAKFNIKATAELKTLTAQVMTRGYMVFIKNIDVKNNKAEISVPTTNEMAPKARLIVYGIRTDNKEIVVSAMDLKVEGLFRNNVSISVDPSKAEPAANITFSIKASPKSYVGLLAVDQSVLLLKSGNDITQQDVESDIAQYDGFGGYWPYRGRGKRSICWRCGWWGISGKDAATIFDNSGVLVFTDAFLYREPLPPRPEIALAAFAGTSAPGNFLTSVQFTTTVANRMNNNNNNNQPENPQVVVRQNFPETWIWTDAHTSRLCAGFLAPGAMLCAAAAWLYTEAKRPSTVYSMRINMHIRRASANMPTEEVPT